MDPSTLSALQAIVTGIVAIAGIVANAYVAVHSKLAPNGKGPTVPVSPLVHKHGPDDLPPPITPATGPLVP